LHISILYCIGQTCVSLWAIICVIMQWTKTCLFQIIKNGVCARSSWLCAIYIYILKPHGMKGYKIFRTRCKFYYISKVMYCGLIYICLYIFIAVLYVMCDCWCFLLLSVLCKIISHKVMEQDFRFVAIFTWQKCNKNTRNLLHVTTMAYTLDTLSKWHAIENVLEICCSSYRSTKVKRIFNVFSLWIFLHKTVASEYVVHFDKQTVAQQHRRFPTFYGTWRFINLSTRAHSY
jgi:hypothetical protein